LSNNNLWDSGARIISDAISRNTSLLHLNLANNHIGRATLEIANSLQHDIRFFNYRSVNLSGNNIPGDDYRRIRKMFLNTMLRVILD